MGTSAGGVCAMVAMPGIHEGCLGYFVV
jgi:hypothetical protein